MDDKELEALVLDSMGEVCLDKRGDMMLLLNIFKEAFKIYSSIKSPNREEMKGKIKGVEKMKEAIEMAKLHEKLGETSTLKPGKFEVDIDEIIQN